MARWLIRDRDPNWSGDCHELLRGLLGIYEVSTQGRRIIAVTLSCILSIARISRGDERPSNLASIIICPNLDSASAPVRATRLPSTRLLLRSSHSQSRLPPQHH